MTIQEIIKHLETVAPPALQEGYDNSGLLVGDASAEANGALVCLDVTEAVVEEARANGCNLIIAHHPVIFGGLKRLTGSTWVERTVMAAIRHHIAIYAIHTNLDNVQHGVNARIAERLGLTATRILSPMKGRLRKLFTFAPHADADKVRQAMFDAGAGHIGNYDQCSFNTEGTGTFRGSEGTNPHVGERGKQHHEPETRIEVIYPEWREAAILHALRTAHPYEEVAYDIVPLANAYQETGAGMVGRLPESMAPEAFLRHLKERMATGCIRYTAFPEVKVETVALCGGSGSFLLPQAIACGAQAFITADFKYHQFFDTEGMLSVLDIGHYESERFTIDLLAELVQENFPTFAVRITSTNTNPVKYFT
jgi:dinuclear metal center YbgI/SA1388 family protein